MEPIERPPPIESIEGPLPIEPIERPPPIESIEGPLPIEPIERPPPIESIEGPLPIEPIERPPLIESTEGPLTIESIGRLRHTGRPEFVEPPSIPRERDPVSLGRLTDIARLLPELPALNRSPVKESPPRERKVAPPSVIDAEAPSGLPWPVPPRGAPLTRPGLPPGRWPPTGPPEPVRECPRSIAPPGLPPLLPLLI